MTDRDLQDDYALGGFDGHLRPGARPALLMVDFARAYFDRACSLYAGVEDALAAAIALANAARETGVPVIFTRVEYVAGDPARDGGVFYRKLPALAAWDRGSAFAEFTEYLHPEADEQVVTKQYPSAFFGTGLAEQLHDAGIDTCVIAGLSTSGCVRATALDALCYGFIPLVVRDACGDRDRRVHDANLFDLQAKYAEVVDAEIVCRYFASL